MVEHHRRVPGLGDELTDEVTKSQGEPVLERRLAGGGDVGRGRPEHEMRAGAGSGAGRLERSPIPPISGISSGNRRVSAYLGQCPSRVGYPLKVRKGRRRLMLNRRGHFVQPPSALEAAQQLGDLASRVGAFVLSHFGYAAFTILVGDERCCPLPKSFERAILASTRRNFGECRITPTGKPPSNASAAALKITAW